MRTARIQSGSERDQVRSGKIVKLSLIGAAARQLRWNEVLSTDTSSERAPADPSAPPGTSGSPQYAQITEDASYASHCPLLCSLLLRDDIVYR